VRYVYPAITKWLWTKLTQVLNTRSVIMGTIEVDIEVYDQISKVRESGVTNMLDKKRVSELVNDRTKQWITDNPEMYLSGIMLGFTVITDTT
tara:strand:+ start:288 stop:563 length:276 start_codon:yes stop_codon:yes gene_type:complete